MIPRATLIFTCSLCLNILFIGVIGGHLSQKLLQQRGEIHTSPTTLPSDKAQLLKQSNLTMRKQTKELRQNMQQSRKELIAVLTAPEFDAEAYQEKADEMNQTRLNMMQTMSDSTKELALQFNQEERNALAQKLMRQKGGHPKHRSRQQRPERQNQMRERMRQERSDQ